MDYFHELIIKHSLCKRVIDIIQYFLCFVNFSCFSLEQYFTVLLLVFISFVGKEIQMLNEYKYFRSENILKLHGDSDIVTERFGRVVEGILYTVS